MFELLSGKCFKESPKDKKEGVKSAGRVFPFGAVVLTLVNSESSQRENSSLLITLIALTSERLSKIDVERKEGSDLFTEVHYHAGKSQCGACEHTLLEDGNTL